MSTEPEDDVVGAIRELTSRDYAEIGVPMILVAEDLTQGAVVHDGPASAENEELAESFRRVWQALEALKPDLTSLDVSHAIELLADRHMRSLVEPNTIKPGAKG